MTALSGTDARKIGMLWVDLKWEIFNYFGARMTQMCNRWAFLWRRNGLNGGEFVYRWYVWGNLDE